MTETFLIENTSRDPFTRLFRSAQPRPTPKILNLPSLRVLPGRPVVVPEFYVSEYASQIADACKLGTIQVKSMKTHSVVDMDAWAEKVRQAVEAARPAPVELLELPVQEEPPAVVNIPVEVVPDAVVEEPPVQEEPVADVPATEEPVAVTVEYLMSLKRSVLEEKLTFLGLAPAKPSEGKLAIAARILEA